MANTVPAASTVPLSSLFALRSLVMTKDAGIIIGKGGKNVQEIRERTEARVNVSEMTGSSAERILTVSGTVNAVAKAYGLIAQKLVDEMMLASTMSVAKPTVITAMIRFLVPNNRMGAIIGKQGSRIKEMQEACDCRMVASDASLGQSTERSVSISGSPHSIELAVAMVASVLEDMGRDRVILYRPGTSENPQQFSPTSGHSTHHQNNSANYQQQQPNPLQNHQINAIPRRKIDDGPQQQVHQQILSQAPSQQLIFIPNQMVGALIGKRGQNINEIRNSSGSQVRIEDTMENGERMVTVTGTLESNQKALLLIYARLDTEKLRIESAAAAAAANEAEGTRLSVTQ